MHEIWTALQTPPAAPGLTLFEAAGIPGFNWLSRILFENWPGTFFQRSTWEDLMYGFWVLLALFAASLLVIEALMRRAGYPPSKRVVRGFSLALTVVGFLSYFSFFNPSVRHSAYYHRHEFYHYFLGSKYSSELGYKRLYECTAVAEIQLGRGSQLRQLEIRNLGEENLIQRITDTTVFDHPEYCTDHFTPERWEAFKADVGWMESVSRGTYWDNMKKDHGYNPPPVWTMAGKFFAQLGPANDHTFKLLSGIDIVLQIGTLLFLGWAFGWRTVALASVFWGCNSAGNFYWTGGGFLRQDWIFLFVASVCLAKKRKFALSGGAFMWSGLLRVFPFAAGFGWFVLMLLHLIRHGRLHKDHLRFLGGALVTAMVLVPASIAVAGAQSYREFAHHIALHNNTPLTNHMGLETMAVHTWDGRMRFARDDSQSDPFQSWKEGRIERKHALRPVFVVVWLALAAWITWALHRTKQFWIGLPLSIPLLFSLTSITCYYMVMFVVFAPLCRVRPALAPAFLATAAGSQVLLAHGYWIDDRFIAISYVFAAFAILPLIAFSRPITRQGLKALFTRRHSTNAAERSASI
jgi:hypothetical protein